MRESCCLVLLHEVDQGPRGPEAWHVCNQVEAIDAFHFQHHMITQDIIQVDRLVTFGLSKGMQLKYHNL